ncbi:stimulated by retinoic acid gene 8 protein-like [Denticeps clupeoides]|uniref:stimulated by retinoic acid gene 8 protein-like n=1 Tax=Denticeps clupeoides TaxID=299321 RepID=UPI0010A41721|nr:stimulated by retinoic acid gene 8 protein-like [Denticeps clupeoides]
MRGSGKRGAKRPRRKPRRRAVQAGNRATLETLFETVKSVVCPDTEETLAKWKILDHAKGFLKEQEAHLTHLLSLKESFLENAEGPSSLEEVREEYRRLYSDSVSTVPQLPATHATDAGKDSVQDPASEGSPPLSQTTGHIQEFDGIVEILLHYFVDRYLYFYGQILQLLLGNGVLYPEQTGLLVVSNAILRLWRHLRPECKASFLNCSVEDLSYSWEGAALVPCGPEASLDMLQPCSQDASTSSLIPEDMFQDASDVIQGQMDASAEGRFCNQGLGSSDMVVPGDWENEVYKAIVGFFKSHLGVDLELTQDLHLVPDDELFLMCTETFDNF